MAAMMAARMVARLAGPLPVRLVEASSLKVTSRRTDVVVRLDGPVLADEAGQVAGGGVGAGQAGDGVDGLAGGLTGGGVLAPAGDLDGLAGVREVQAADVSGLQGAGLDAAVPGLAGGAAARYLPPGQRLDPGVQQRLVFLHDGDVVGFLVVCQPVQVRPDRVEGVGGHHGAVQVQDSRSSVKWLVSLCLTSTSRWSRSRPPCSATPGRWTRVPSARRAPREVLPSTATALNRSRASAFACPAARRAR